MSEIWRRRGDRGPIIFPVRKRPRQETEREFLQAYLHRGLKLAIEQSLCNHAVIHFLSEILVRIGKIPL